MKIHKTLTLGIVLAAASVFAMTPTSGLKVGEGVTPFHPTHLAGPDKGTDNCPPCTYGNRPAVQVWVNGDTEANITGIQKALSTAVTTYKTSELKGFVIMLTHCDHCVDNAKMMASKTPYTNIALATLPTTDEAVNNYKISVDDTVRNTVIVYRNKKVVANFVNLEANPKGIAMLNEAIKAATK